MDNLYEVDDASTPLTEEEKQGLKPSWITTRSELNDLERQGVLQAEKWLMNRRQIDILNEIFIKRLHNIMFKDTWDWAGKFRTTERNIGVAPYQIATQLRQLFDDVNYWMENETYSPDEIGARFHHKLVWIHPFPNGNGRHSRLMANILMSKMKQPKFTWGQGSLVEVSELRKKYIDALREADNGNYNSLLDFVRLK